MFSKFFVAIFGLCLVPLLWADSAAAADSSSQRTRAARSARRTAQLKRQAEALKPAAESSANKTDESARFQMLAAGRRIVILDTQTGETRIVEPASSAPYQNVEVGRAWFVVTVIGNLSDGNAEARPQPHK